MTMYDECGNRPAVCASGMTRLVLPGGIVAYGKTGARYGYSAGRPAPATATPPASPRPAT
ncbi:hypothetical protein ACIBQ1_11505 [Nonomuraea sp. NPDC050153]|uniref:hypothetical protein n=1 Tax=Nonomuraea sp. NPDC050153 TaxID=3364359 RepID=UPI0037896A98